MNPHKNEGSMADLVFAIKYFFYSTPSPTQPLVAGLLTNWTVKDY